MILASDSRPIRQSKRSSRIRVGLVFVIAFLSTHASQAYGQGVLENPSPDSHQSGIGIVSGWKCTAGALSLSIDGMPSTKVAYNTSRGDTQSVCGDADNGFSYLINWNLLGAGTHTVTVYDNGAQFAQATFDVTTLGSTFIQDAAVGTKHVVDFPYADGALPSSSKRAHRTSWSSTWCRRELH